MEKKMFKKELQTLEFVKDYISKNGHPPVYEDIANKFKVARSVAYHRCRNFRPLMKRTKVVLLKEQEWIDLYSKKGFDLYLTSELAPKLHVYYFIMDLISGKSANVLESVKANISDCCRALMIAPNEEEAENMGSLHAAYSSYICKKCCRVCKPLSNQTR